MKDPPFLIAAPRGPTLCTYSGGPKLVLAVVWYPPDHLSTRRVHRLLTAQRAVHAVEGRVALASSTKAHAAGLAAGTTAIRIRRSSSAPRPALSRGGEKAAIVARRAELGSMDAVAIISDKKIPKTQAPPENQPKILLR